MKFADVLGQQGAIQLLKSRLKNGTALDTSYIFAGGHGQGKTTLARIYARAALCLDLDKDAPEPCNVCDNCLAILDGAPGAFEERDAASGGTIDNVRGMVEDLPFALMNAPKRVWLFDEAHRMSIGAQDVLLKPLEEKKVVGVFCTTEPEKIRGPIRSRCEEYTIRKVTRDDVLVRMKRVLDAEQVPHEDDAVLTVIDFSGGHVRDVLNRLEMIAQIGTVSLENVREYLNLGLVSIYYEILLALGDPKVALTLVEQACERVAPEDVTAGLAEAAMNSYRLANGMYADFLYADRALAQRVYDQLGLNVLKLAEFFLRNRSVSRIGLSCDIVSLAQSGGVVPELRSVTSAPPIVVAVTPPQGQVPQVATQRPVAPTLAPESPQATAPTPPRTPVPGPAVAVAQGNGRMRPDGVGSLGSGDVRALTEVDHNGVPQAFPRKAATTTKIPFSFQGAQDDENRLLTPDEWRREFDRTWPRT